MPYIVVTEAGDICQIESIDKDLLEEHELGVVDIFDADAMQQLNAEQEWEPIAHYRDHEIT